MTCIWARSLPSVTPTSASTESPGNSARTDFIVRTGPASDIRSSTSTILGSYSLIPGAFDCPIENIKRISVALAVCLLVSVAVSEGPVASLREAAAIGDAQEKE